MNLARAYFAAAALLGTTAWAWRASEPVAPTTVFAADSLVSPARPGSAEPFLTVGADNRVYMTWLEPAAPGYSLRFSIFDGTSWTPAKTTVTREDFFVNWADFPSIEVLGGKRLAAHWLQRNGKSVYAYDVRISMSNDERVTRKAVVSHAGNNQSPPHNREDS